MILIYRPSEGEGLSRPRHRSQCAAQSCVSRLFREKHKLLPAARFEPGPSRASGKRAITRPLRPADKEDAAEKGESRTKTKNVRGTKLQMNEKESSTDWRRRTRRDQTASCSTRARCTRTQCDQRKIPPAADADTHQEHRGRCTPVTQRLVVWVACTAAVAAPTATDGELDQWATSLLTSTTEEEFRRLLASAP